MGFMSVLSLSAFAQKPQAVFNQTINDYRDANASIEKNLKKYSLNELLPGYTPHVAETDYYAEQTPSDTLAQQGANAVKKNAITKTVKDNFYKRPLIHINDNDPDMKNSQVIEDNAEDFLNGDLQTQRCTIKTSKKICITSVRTLHQVCDQTPTITIKETTSHHQENSNGSIPAQTNTTGTFTVPYDGVIQAFSVTLKSNNVWVCHRTYVGNVNGVLISQMQGQCHKYLGDLHFSNQNLSIPVKKNTPIAFAMSGYAKGKWQWANFSLTMIADESKKTAQITWQIRCRYV